MNHRWLFGTVSALLLITAGMETTAVAADAATAPELGAARSAAPARAADAANSPDLTGDWRLDPKRSDAPSFGPGGPGGAGRPGGAEEGGGRGGWGGGRGRRGDEGPGDGEARPARLPDLMHVTQTRTMVSFEDTSGHVIREITTVSAKADSFAHATGAQQLRGQWNGAQLMVERVDPRGRKLTETVTLEDDGHTLVIHTRLETAGSTPAREIKRVYVLVSAP